MTFPPPPGSQIPAAYFREVLGHLPTGVTVVTASGPEGPVGMAANSVTSVSIEPPLILVCPGKSSETWPAIRLIGRFCVNITADHQGELCRRFAGRREGRFDGIGFHMRPAGPALDEAVAWIDCSVRDEHDAGDHTIVVADVLGMETGVNPTPLVFFKGRYGTFVPGSCS
jgi:3-hydroxy-9,10-secoandrosta-1,3,5(10)-triene-9,17-dione monooxygenase reductase component